VVMVVAISLPYYRTTEPSKWHNFDPSLRETGAFDEHTTYLAFQDDLFDLRQQLVAGVAFGPAELPAGGFGGLPMYAPLRFVNGYTPLGGPKAYYRVFGVGGFGRIRPPTVSARIVSVFASPGGLLQRLGIDGLVLGGSTLSNDSRILEKQGWKCVAKINGIGIFHRGGPPSPRVWSSADGEYVSNADEVLDRLAQSPRNLPNLLAADPGARPGLMPDMARADVSAVCEKRLSVRCAVCNPSDRSPALVALSRAYFPGYRAFLNGVELPVKVLNGFQPAVLLPPGTRGELCLVFASKLFVVACGLAAAGVLLIAGFLIGSWLTGRSARGASYLSGT
jgi:hypothetical protein